VQRLSREFRSPVTTGLIVGVLALAIFGVVRGGTFIVVDSLVTGAIWALVAAGLALTFGVMGVPNFAQGEFFMVGTLSGYLVYTALSGVQGRPYVPFVTILMALVVGFVLGALVDLAVFSQMRRRIREGWVMNTFVVTVGISVVMINAHQLIWGTDYKGIVAYFDGPPIHVLGVSVALDRVFAISVAAVAIAGLWWLLSYSRIGRAIRAVSQDEPGALMVGINVGRMRTLTFAISSGLAALAGATLLFQFPSFPFVGVKPLYVAWTVVILAGLGNVGGAVVAGFIIALLEANTGFFIGSAWEDVVPFALIVLILAVRPTGLFGRAVRSVWEQ
ncbi:MAG TPA: branched-chain amino acid ABC transporter permease, partial [Candidatus Dormibacteraeota bacterium]|nr:branched-chain amino acid ABC transporter permease [Candidatus Dormibacteraeota bacterium]